MPRQPQPPLVSTRTIMCAKCGTPLEGHEMFGECFPHDDYLRESSALLHRWHLIAV
jgi:predicted amidophosphoribosyltransferase